MTRSDKAFNEDMNQALRSKVKESMIEKVARAIAQCGDCRGATRIPCLASNPEKCECFRFARAAIEAMREPDEETLAYAARIFGANDDDTLPTMGWIKRAVRAYADAALSKEDK